jgi:hypothetical protein
MSDKKSVVLKLVDSETKEFHSHSSIISLERTSHYFISIYDTIILPNSDDNLILVLPLLHLISTPRFESIFEILACFSQLSEVRLFHASICIIISPWQRASLFSTKIILPMGVFSTLPIHRLNLSN